MEIRHQRPSFPVFGETGNGKLLYLLFPLIEICTALPFVLFNVMNRIVNDIVISIENASLWLALPFK